MVTTEMGPDIDFPPADVILDWPEVGRRGVSWVVTESVRFVLQVGVGLSGLAQFSLICRLEEL